MKTNSYYVIGLMSGTSLDGLDLCYVKFEKDNNWKFEILCAETIEYSEKWTLALKNAISLPNEELAILDKKYSTYLSVAIENFIKNNELNKIDLICSHGHTVFHQPENGLTYQIGNLPELKSNFTCPIICDFRIQDVTLGGQGAPLVPIGDRLLFSNYDYCLNLGGFANVSYEDNGKRIAYDICPVNIVMNPYANMHGLDYDANGEMARSGSIHKELLGELNGLQYYKQIHPKSLGLEWVQKEIFPLINKFNLDVRDVLRTFVEHIAIQIKACTSKKSISQILVTGGGVFNDFLIERIKDSSICQIVVPKDDVINYKEALIFGFLGLLRLRNEVNCLSSVTGASKDHSSGKLYS